MSEVFHCERRVGFGEVDWARILYYPRFLHHCHLAFELFMEEALARPYASFLEADDLGFPTVHVETRYMRPIPYGSTLRMAVSVARMGRSSMDVRYVGCIDGGEPAASALVTNVLVRMSSFASLPMPAWVRKGRERYLEADA